MKAFPFGPDGKYGSVYAHRVLVESNDRVTGDECFGSLTFSLKGHPSPEQILKITGAEFNYLHLDMKAYRRSDGSIYVFHGGDARRTDRKSLTDKQRSVIYGECLQLAERLFADPVWMAETAIDLAREKLEKLEGNREGLLRELQDTEANIAEAREQIIARQEEYGKVLAKG